MNKDKLGRCRLLLCKDPTPNYGKKTTMSLMCFLVSLSPSLEISHSVDFFAENISWHSLQPDDFSSQSSSFPLTSEITRLPEEFLSFLLSASRIFTNQVRQLDSVNRKMSGRSSRVESLLKCFWVLKTKTMFVIKIIVVLGFPLEDPPLEFPLIRSPSAWMLVELWLGVFIR